MGDLPAAPAPGRATFGQVKEAINELCSAALAQDLSVGDFRKRVSSHMGHGENGLEAYAEEVNKLIKAAAETSGPPAETAAQNIASIVAHLGAEDRTAKRQVYLATLSRILPGTAAHAPDLKDLSAFTRAAVADCFRRAFDDPLPPQSGGPGRKRSRSADIVTKIAVFRETHADSEPHFHVAILLRGPTGSDYSTTHRWGPAKRSLRERDGLAAHFSSTHTQLWSALRYGFISTLKKPNVDATPYLWSADGSWPTGPAAEGSTGRSLLFEESQKPWAAET